MGGPGGFGRGRGGRGGPTDEEREAERKRKMEERKYKRSPPNSHRWKIVTYRTWLSYV